MNWFEWNEWFEVLESPKQLRMKLNLYNLDMFITFGSCHPCVSKRYPILNMYKDIKGNIDPKKVNNTAGFDFMPPGAKANIFTMNVILNFLIKGKLPEVGSIEKK